jgi:hypothetical protein
VGIERSTIRVELDLGLLPIKLCIAVLWLLTLGFCVFAISTAIG